MKTIATFSKPEEAHLFRTRLEAVEIPAFVFDENIIQLDWLYSNAIGGVRVQVNDEDVEAAKEFLAEDKGVPMSDAVAACPACGSHDVAPDEMPRKLAFWSVLIGAPLVLLLGPSILYLLKSRRWECRACQHAWKESARALTVTSAPDQA